MHANENEGHAERARDAAASVRKFREAVAGQLVKQGLNTAIPMHKKTCKRV